MRDQWIEWLGERQRHFFYGILFVVALLFVGFQIVGKRQASFMKKRQEAALVFDKWMSQAEPFEKLAELMRKHPELETTFATRIVDKLLLENQGERAAEFASGVFKRVEKYVPEHVRYAQASLLIAKGQFQEALETALILKQRLEPASVLYGFNLIRIASLYRCLTMAESELSALQEIEQYLKQDGEAQRVVSECFAEAETTLADYIAERKHQASSSSKLL